MTSRRITDLLTGAITYMGNKDCIQGKWDGPSGETEYFPVGTSAILIPQIEKLREELRDWTLVASGRTPRLREFTESWGRAFFPPSWSTSLPEIAVIVLFGDLHDLPLHLVQRTAQKIPVGAEVGISYASSMSLFVRCADRNPARQMNLTDWTFDGLTPPQGQCPVTNVRSGGVDALRGQSERFGAICQDLSRIIQPDWADKFRVPYNRAMAKAACRIKEKVDLLCMMAHGYVDGEDHRMSGLLLAEDMLGTVSRPIPLHGGRTFFFRDLPLRALPADVETVLPAEMFTAAEMEIDASLATQLVALLGCSAGSGRVLEGDEPASLAETFLHIGAPSVIAPLWDSDMDATHEWARHFLTAWARLGLPKALAARYALQQTSQGSFAADPCKYGVMALRGDWL